jgi:hypothetical protein
MDWSKCDTPGKRRLFVILAVLFVALAALFLYIVGRRLGAGLLYEFAVLFLFCLALAGAIAFALLLYALLRHWCVRRGAPPKGKGTRERSGPSKLHLPSTIYKRPDPLIYSQYFLMAQGLAVTWDNPDIWITELPAGDGSMAPVASHALLPGHKYRVHARILNGSLEAPAVGMPVFFSFLTFGIGIVPTLIGVTVVDLPVKGASGHPAHTFHDWLTPPTPGHYCIQVGLFWGDDAEPGNNLGQENIDIKKIASPATFQFALRNDALALRRFRFEVDTYPPPVAPPCPEPPEPDTHQRTTNAGVTRANRVERLAAHRRAAHPLPQGWSVNFSPGPELVLQGGEQVNIVAVVTAPTASTTPQPVNVNAFADEVFAGGVTLYVHS